MYEAIEAYGAEFDNLRGTLAVQHGASIDGIRSALEATARRIGDTPAHTEQDRDNLARLYRGFTAAARMVEHVRDVHLAAQR